MRALRNRLILLTVCLIVVAAVCVALFSILFIRNNERRQSEQLLLLLCETGERNLDYYFENVQKSVGKVSSFAEDNLDGLEKEQIKQHVEKVREYFSDMAWKTNGVLTYYYRIDPTLSENAEGFWYTNLEDEGFVEQEMTDISGYNLEDPTQLVWFTVPKSTREPVWLPPYTTDSLDLHVISYNVPILWKDQFVGVVGIDIDYSTMAELVESIRLFSDGYAFITNEQGDLVFHPRIDVTQLTEAERPEVPEGLLSESTFVRYNYEGVDKQAVWLPLSNGNRLYVSVPVSETNGDWQGLIWKILVVAAVVILILSAAAILILRRMKELQDSEDQ